MVYSVCSVRFIYFYILSSADVFGPPAITTITAITSTTATVIWSPPTQNGSGEILSFLVEYGRDHEPAKFIAVDAQSDRARLGDLLANKVYFVRVRAKNVVGNSDFSPVVTFSTEGVKSKEVKRKQLMVI